MFVYYDKKGAFVINMISSNKIAASNTLQPRNYGLWNISLEVGI